MQKWNEHKWDKLQHVDVGNEDEYCRCCKSDILDVANFTYNGEVRSEPTYWEELCVCKKCNNSFVIHYDIFDADGHIYSRVFSEDINNKSYKWQETLTDAQKEIIAGHLESCDICRDRLSAEMLSDAWLSSFMEGLRSLKRKE